MLDGSAKGKWPAFLLSAILLVCRPPTAFAQTTARGPDFEAVTDQYMEKVLSEYHVAGAAVSVVKDGEVLFQKGYGYADLEDNVPVNGETTAFQIASVTKLFTATAVMQMVEQGALDLDTDVNQYLTTFQIENEFDTPVTLRHLLTHTAGLDDRMPLYIQSAGDILFDDLEPLEAVVRQSLPPVVREPGAYCQYNVMGMALAGYLVESASGMPFEQYVTQEILAPLGMAHSSYSLTGDIASIASKSYRYANEDYSPGGYTLNSNHPSGAVFASAGDMARFMLAHLDGAGCVLSADSLALMHTHQYPADSRLTGYSLGFYETIRNGRRTIEHGGYLPRFSSKLTLLPEQDIGMFIALNTDSADSGKVCNEYVDLFYEYFTDPPASDVETVKFDMDADAISGAYTLEGYGLTDSTKIKSQLLTCRLACDENGNLRFTGEGLDWRFHYVGGGMFYSSENGNYCRVSLQNGNWVLNILGADHTKVNAFEGTLFRIFIASQPIFAGMLLLQIVLLIRRKGSALGVVSALIGILDLCFLAAIIAMPILLMAGNTGLLLTVIQPAIPLIGWAYLIATTISLVLITRAWHRRIHKKAARITYTVFSLLSLSNLFFIACMTGLRF